MFNNNKRVNSNKQISAAIYDEKVILPIINTVFKDQHIEALIDSGASVNVISSRLINPKWIKNERETFFVATDEHSVRSLGTCTIKLKIGLYYYKIDFTVLENPTRDIFLGIPFLRQECAILDFNRQLMYIGKEVRQTVYWLDKPVDEDDDDEAPILAGGEYPEKFYELVNDFRDLFRVGKIQPTTKATVHNIIIKPEFKHKIINRPCYPCNPRKKQLMYEQVREMLSMGVIEPSHSSFSSPPVIIEREGKDPRFCIDYRLLNEITEDESSHLPLIASANKDLGNAKIFSTMDLKKGYWQVKLNPDHKHYTAFSTPDGGHYQFIVMPFGLKGAPATFQKMMVHEVLTGYLHSFVQCYLDDIIVYSDNINQHLKHLRLVFERLAQHNLKLSVEKCNFFKTNLNFLGHQIIDNYIYPQEKHIEQIKKFPVPKTKKQLQSFLGTCNWLREYVPNLAQLTAPLTELLKKKVNFKWSKQCEQAFERTKIELSKPVALSRPNFEQTFILQTDSSGIGMACVLYQENTETGAKYIISHRSAKFSSTIKHYHINEQECLCVIWAINQFKQYLEDRHFILRTDSRALTWLNKFKDTKSKLTRWALQLQEYSFIIEHVPGRCNELPDFLSRNPEDNVVSDDLQNMDRLLPPERMKQTFHKPNLCEIRVHSLLTLHNRIVDVQKTTPSIQNKIRTLRTLVEREPRTNYQRDLLKHYYIFDDILYRKGTPYDRIVVPRKLQKLVISEFHDLSDASHPGTAETIRKVTEKFYWGKMANHIRTYVNNCRICAICKTQQKQVKAPLRPRTPTKPFEIISIDILGPYTASKTYKNEFIVFVEDIFSKWVEAKAFRNPCDSKQVVNYLKSEIYPRYGYPKLIITDNGSHFISDVFKRHCTELNIDHATTPIYHQRANPIERRVQELKKIFRVLLLGLDQKTWDTKIPQMLQVLRTRVNRATGETPAKILLGYDLPLPGEWQINYPKSRAYPTYRERRLKHEKVFQRQRNFNEKEFPENRSPKIKFQVNDQVNIREHDFAGKPFIPAWKGPCIVTKVLDEVTYLVELEGREYKVHVDNMRRTPSGNNLDQESTTSGSESEFDFPTQDDLNRVNSNVDNASSSQDYVEEPLCSSQNSSQTTLKPVSQIEVVAEVHESPWKSDSFNEQVPKSASVNEVPFTQDNLDDIEIIDIDDNGIVAPTASEAAWLDNLVDNPYDFDSTNEQINVISKPKPCYRNSINTLKSVPASENNSMIVKNLFTAGLSGEVANIAKYTILLLISLSVLWIINLLI